MSTKLPARANTPRSLARAVALPDRRAHPALPSSTPDDAKRKIDKLKRQVAGSTKVKAIIRQAEVRTTPGTASGRISDTLHLEVPQAPPLEIRIQRVGVAKARTTIPQMMRDGTANGAVYLVHNEKNPEAGPMLFISQKTLEQSLRTENPDPTVAQMLAELPFGNVRLPRLDASLPDDIAPTLHFAGPASSLSSNARLPLRHPEKDSDKATG